MNRYHNPLKHRLTTAEQAARALDCARKLGVGTDNILAVVAYMEGYTDELDLTPDHGPADPRQGQWIGLPVFTCADRGVA